MTRNESRLTLEMKAEALKALIDDFNAQLFEVSEALDALNAQPQKEETTVKFFDVSAFRDMSDEVKPDIISISDNGNPPIQTIALEGPLTEEPEVGTPILMREQGGNLPSGRLWTGEYPQSHGIKTGWVYPHTPGGAAGAMLGFNPNKP